MRRVGGKAPDSESLSEGSLSGRQGVLPAELMCRSAAAYDAAVGAGE